LDEEELPSEEKLRKMIPVDE
jgi:hypothetical protein